MQQSFVVSRNGRPLGELRPLRRDRLVETGLVMAAFGNAPSINADALRRDLDAVVDDTVEPRG